MTVAIAALCGFPDDITICGRVLAWSDFTVDHVDPHRNGGRSRLHRSRLVIRRSPPANELSGSPLTGWAVTQEMPMPAVPTARHSSIRPPGPASAPQLLRSCDGLRGNLTPWMYLPFATV